LENEKDIWEIIEKNSSKDMTETDNRLILKFYMEIRAAAKDGLISSGNK